MPTILNASYPAGRAKATPRRFGQIERSHLERMNDSVPVAAKDRR
jgi:hypothetical protein